jgi:maltodextrin utilization protein YvdJ
MHFEIFVVLIFGLGTYFMFRHHTKLEEYKEKNMDVLLVKNYELSQEQSDDDEDNNTDFSMGQMQRHSHGEEVMRKEALKKYKETMETMSKEIFRNYIDCTWFTSANKSVFLTLVFFQIMMAVGFNSVIDVPTMIFIIIVFATFSLR